MQQITVYTLDGTNHLGDLQTADIDISLASLDGSGGAASDEMAIETKRSSRHNFTLNVQNGSGAPMTSNQIALLDVGGASKLGFTKSFTLAVSTKTDDGSGIGDDDTCPVALKRKVSGSIRELVPLSAATPDLIDRANSNTPADRQFVVDVNLGAVRFTLPVLLTKATQSENNGAFTTIDASFEKRGAITSPSSGTSIYAVAFIGDALLTMVFTKTNGTVATTYTASGVVSSLSVSVEDGQIVKASGTIDIQGPITIAEV